MDRPEPPSSLAELFRRFACQSAELVGSSGAFMLALLVIVTWAATGPVFGFSDTWQLLINTGTTIVTFLMVFLIQNAQNRDNKALHLKLDELIHAMKDARNEIMDVEDMSDEELARLQKEFIRKSKERSEDASDASARNAVAPERRRRA